jgi:hypothetical protein
MSRAISTIVDNGNTREAKIQGKRKKRRRASERIQRSGCLLHQFIGITNRDCQV